MDASGFVTENINVVAQISFSGTNQVQDWQQVAK